jgi:MULE transposase domain
VHEFSSYAHLKTFVDECARRHGFQLIWDVKGGEDKLQHGGSANCWCRGSPPADEAIDVINPVAQKKKRAVKVTHREQLHCNCGWRVCWNRKGEKREEWVWHITKTRVLTHTGHEVKASSSTGLVIDSLRQVPADMELLLQNAVRSGMTGQMELRRFTEKQLRVSIDDNTFHNLVQKTKRSLGVAVNDEEEFSILLRWLLKEVEEHRAVARFSTEAGNKVIDRVFYMSTDMIHNLDRNGCVLIMDTTFKTNRFLWPLLLVCGINEHFQTVLLGCALLHHQGESDFVWALEQMKTAVSAAAWEAVSCVATDGDEGMRNAIEAVLPHAHQIRCWYHLEQNLRHNLSSFLTVHFDEFLTEWKGVCGKETEEEYQRARGELHRAYPAAVEYLEKNTWKNAALFVQCFTKRWCTLGILSTQRVEGMNAKLKTVMHVSSKTPLNVLFETLRWAASEIDRKAQEKMKELEAEWLKRADKDRLTFNGLIKPHLTRYAQVKVREQFDLVHNYRHTQEVVDGILVFYVQRVSRVGTKRVVKVTADTMDCSCFFPATHLLPCRHVLCLNQQLMLTPFVPAQVGQRWMKKYKPPLGASTASLSLPLPPNPSTPLPSYLSTCVQAGEIPAQNRRAGELRGLCDTIVSRGSEDKDNWFTILAWVRELTQRIEELGAAPRSSSVSSSAPLSQPSPSTLASLSQPSSSTALDNDDALTRLTSLHPSLTIGEVQQPLRPLSKRHRAKEKRTASQGERRKSKRNRHEGLSLTQA